PVPSTPLSPPFMPDPPGFPAPPPALLVPLFAAPALPAPPRTESLTRNTPPGFESLPRTPPAADPPVHTVPAAPAPATDGSVARVKPPPPPPPVPPFLPAVPGLPVPLVLSAPPPAPPAAGTMPFAPMPPTTNRSNGSMSLPLGEWFAPRALMSIVPSTCTSPVTKKSRPNLRTCVLTVTPELIVRLPRTLTQTMRSSGVASPKSVLLLTVRSLSYCTYSTGRLLPSTVSV